MLAATHTSQMMFDGAFQPQGSSPKRASLLFNLWVLTAAPYKLLFAVKSQCLCPQFYETPSTDQKTVQNGQN